MLLLLLSTFLLRSSCTVVAAAENVTMYHIHSKAFGAIADPSNMNLGDQAGDLFFDMAELMMLLPCSETNTNEELPSFVACQNQEYWSDTSVISELVVQVQQDDYGHYAACNVCNDQGTSPVRKTHQCQPGQYVCDCETDPCSDPRVGRMTPGASGYFGRLCEDPKYSDNAHQFFCAIAVAINRVGGYWYTTLDIGKGTTWTLLETVKTIDKQCHQQSFRAAVQAHGDPHCFRECSTIISDPCYVECFIEAALGQEARNAPVSSGGMSRDELLEAWGKPFASSDPKEGGCPDIREEIHPHHGYYAAEVANAMSYLFQTL